MTAEALDARWMAVESVKVHRGLAEHVGLSTQRSGERGTGISIVPALVKEAPEEPD